MFSETPSFQLALLRSVANVFPFADSLKPVPLHVVSVFGPFIDDEINHIAIGGLADEL